MKVLFVSGFNAHPDNQHGSDLYTSFDLYFRFSNYEVTFFRYKTTEPLNDVYKRLTDILDTKQHDLILCHSMGSCLAVKYIQHTGDKRRFILCMPFLQASLFTRLLGKIPILQHIYVPKCCLLPNHMIFDGGNILNDEITPVACNQVYSAVHDFFLPEDELIQTVNTHNIHIIYSINEMVSPIDPQTLALFKTDRISYSKGKHVSFSNAYYMGDFFEVFTNVLKKDV
jgi:hypothetical protein